MKYVPWIAVAVLAFLIGRALAPAGTTETITLPGTTDTVTVTTTVLDSVEKVVFRDRPVVTTDTVILVETRYVTRPDTLTVLAPRWRLTALEAGQSLTEPTYVSADLLRYDGALTRIQSVEHYPVTLGPVEAIRTGPGGIRIEFGTWPEPPRTCGVGCRLQWALGGFAAGVVLWEVAR